jgi:hypothetical protein
MLFLEVMIYYGNNKHNMLYIIAIHCAAMLSLHQKGIEKK